MLAFIFWHNIDPIWQIGMELLLLGSFGFGWWWIFRMNQPFRLIATGIENIRSNDFGIQLRPTGQPDFDQLIEVYNAMIIRLRQERISASEMNQLLASIIRASPTGIVLFDFDDRIKAVNPAAEKLLQHQEAELAGKNQAELSIEMAALLYHRQENWKVIRQSARQIFRVYSGRFINRGFETRFVLFEEFSEEIYQLERQAFEKVIRMMSHEVNNTLGPVNSVLETYIESHHDRFAETFAICRERNQNLNRFMRRLSEVVKIPAPDLQETDLVPLIKQILVLLKPRFQDKKIEWELQSGTPLFVRCDPQQMEQVLINILLNAAEAILDAGFVRITPDPVHYQLAISNNGKPISPEVEKHLFAPFFTTKPDGQGIGLTLCREILKKHNFNFSLSSSESGITTFLIRFK
jgi:signal transduction histidine kinase